jgi:hypothetical protein
MAGAEALSFSGKIEEFIAAAKKLQEVADKLQGIDTIVEEVNRARSAVANVLEAYQEYEVEVQRMRFVNLRLLYAMQMKPAPLFGENDEDNLRKLRVLEEQYRTEFDQRKADEKKAEAGDGP